MSEVMTEQWVRVARVEDFPSNSGACVKRGNEQAAVSHRDWYACQNMCPHKRDMVLARGLHRRSRRYAQSRLPPTQEDVLAERRAQPRGRGVQHQDISSKSRTGLRLYRGEGGLRLAQQPLAKQRTR